MVRDVFAPRGCGRECVCASSRASRGARLDHRARGSVRFRGAGRFGCVRVTGQIDRARHLKSAKRSVVPTAGASLSSQRFGSRPSGESFVAAAARAVSRALNERARRSDRSATSRSRLRDLQARDARVVLTARARSIPRRDRAPPPLSRSRFPSRQLGDRGTQISSVDPLTSPPRSRSANHLAGTCRARERDLNPRENGSRVRVDGNDEPDGVRARVDDDQPRRPGVPRRARAGRFRR